MTNFQSSDSSLEFFTNFPFFSPPPRVVPSPPPPPTSLRNYSGAYGSVGPLIIILTHADGPVR